MYKDKATFLIYTEVIPYDSIKQSTLIQKTKNWASTAFANLKEVLVSETDDQLVLNYVTSAYYVKVLDSKSPFNWYVRMVIQIKDGKIKVSFFDDENVCYRERNTARLLPHHTT